MALAGADGQQAAKLLRASVKHGAATLGTLAEAAIKRVLANPRRKTLFTDDERKQLAQALAATNATAELLGRARIRRRLQQAQQHAEKFSEHHATDFSCFDEAPIRPLVPAKALEWFRRLIPGLYPDSKGFDERHQRQGFTLAVTTEKTLLAKIQNLISRALETGDRIRQTPEDIDKLLGDAGVSPRNPQFSEMAFRTNMMSAYNEGTHAEMQEPDIAPHFPVWQYLGTRDGRQGKDHKPHFDQYYPNHVSFEEVRGERVYKSEWRRLQEQGVQVSRFHEDFCGGKGGKPGPCPEENKPASGDAPKSKSEHLASDIAKLKVTPQGRHILARGQHVAAKVKQSVASGVKAALDSIDAESRGGISLIAGGHPAAGMAQILNSVFTCVHEEVFENALSQHSFPGAHAVGMGAASLAVKGEQALLKAVSWAWGQIKSRGVSTHADAPLTDGDKLLLRKLTEVVRRNVQAVYAAAGRKDVEIDTDKIQRRLLALLRQQPATAHAERDTSDEPRDASGKWTSGGGAAKKDKPEKEKSSKSQLATKAARVPEKTPSEKAQRAKAAHKLINADVQRYAEEHNEPAFAAAVKGAAFPDSEPVDVAIPADKKDLDKWQKEGERWRQAKASGDKKPAPMDLSGCAAHGVEMKTMVDNGNNKLTMDSYSQVRKIEWEQKHGATFHTVVLDDQAVFNAKGKGKHDESKRRIFYRRGVAGSARVAGMHECKDMDELKRLMNAPESELPPAAQRTDGKLRVGKWKYFEDEEGKGYKNQKTGQIVRAKK